MRVGVATIVAGRRAHLARQARAVARLAGVDAYLIVAMDEAPVDVPGAEVRRVPAAAGGLPLAAARNAAIEALADHDLVVMLDADCIPSPHLTARYVAATRSLGGDAGLLNGPVGYLSEEIGGDGELTGAVRARARRRVVREFPARDVRREPRADLFWSLSFAVAPAVHRRVGGFDEGFTGWGAEDTDYGLRARAAGVELWFVGGAWAYHQAHPRSGPGRAAEVAGNATRFHRRWGYWPMPDVLAELARSGAIRWAPDGVVCEPAG